MDGRTAAHCSSPGSGMTGCCAWRSPRPWLTPPRPSPRPRRRRRPTPEAHAVALRERRGASSGAAPGAGAAIAVAAGLLVVAGLDDRYRRSEATSGTGWMTRITKAIPRNTGTSRKAMWKPTVSDSTPRANGRQRAGDAGGHRGRRPMPDRSGLRSADDTRDTPSGQCTPMPTPVRKQPGDDHRPHREGPGEGEGAERRRRWRAAGGSRSASAGPGASRPAGPASMPPATAPREAAAGGRPEAAPLAQQVRAPERQAELRGQEAHDHGERPEHPAWHGRACRARGARGAARRTRRRRGRARPRPRAARRPRPTGRHATPGRSRPLGRRPAAPAGRRRRPARSPR